MNFFRGPIALERHHFSPGCDTGITGKERVKAKKIFTCEFYSLSFSVIKRYFTKTVTTFMKLFAISQIMLRNFFRFIFATTLGNTQLFNPPLHYFLKISEEKVIDTWISQNNCKP